MLVVAFGWALALVASGLMILAANPGLQLESSEATLAASFIPYAALGWAAAAAVLITARRRRLRLLALAALALAVVAAQSWGPYWPRPTASGTPNLTVMTLNTYYGWADADQLVAEAERSRPDVVVLSEVTQATWEDLQRTAWPAMFPHRVGEPADPWHSEATMVFSSHPLTLESTVTGSHQQQVVRVALPQGPAMVIAAHPTNPSDSLTAWASDLEAVGSLAQSRASLPVVVAGDLNATREHLPLKRLLAEGLSDAREQSGSGWLPTFPTRAWAWLQNFPAGPAIPPLVGLDHVLVNHLVSAVSVRSFAVDGTDHLGLVAELRT